MQPEILTAHGAVHRQTEKKWNELIRIIVKQDDKEISLKKEYDKNDMDGLSWGVAEVKQQAFDHTKPLVITCSTEEKGALTLKAIVYAVKYE